MKVKNARKLIDMVIHLHSVIKDSTQVPNSGRRKYFNVETKRQMLKAFIVIIERRSNEEFSFVRIHHEFLVCHPDLKVLNTAGQFKQSTRSIPRDSRIKCQKQLCTKLKSEHKFLYLSCLPCFQTIHRSFRLNLILTWNFDFRTGEFDNGKSNKTYLQTH